ncbi:MAG: hypothetical protein QNJ47_14230 [Nostocaceae cyanobacterium]|nr:hypothetical protein [Nostocaceae cyanobacterium]
MNRNQINNVETRYIASLHPRCVSTPTVRLYTHGASLHPRCVSTPTVRLYTHGASLPHGDNLNLELNHDQTKI